LRDVLELRQAAEHWRDAETDEEQAEIFNEFGVRWSEFWRLSCWDPTSMLVVDSMHCLLEGLCDFHTLRLLHMTRQDVESAVPKQPVFRHGFRVPFVEEATCVAEAHDNDDHFEAQDNEVHAHPDPAHSRSPHTFGEPWTLKDVKHVTRIHEILTAPCLPEEGAPSDTYRTAQPRLPKWLKARAVGALRYVFDDLGLVPSSIRSKPPTKDTCIDVLDEWASAITQRERFGGLLIRRIHGLTYANILPDLRVECARAASIAEAWAANPSFNRFGKLDCGRSIPEQARLLLFVSVKYR
jgi:hypothetical protein